MKPTAQTSGPHNRLWPRLWVGIGTVLSVLILSLPASAQMRSISTYCVETDPELFFTLLNTTVQPYIPPLDRNGNTLLTENEIYIQKSQHYFAEYKDFQPVEISLNRYASVTENNPAALENFESKITVLGPNCEQINLYRNRLVGKFQASFRQIMEIIELGQRTENPNLVQFASNQLTPTDMDFEDVLEVLSNDLSLDRGVINQMIPDDLRTQFVGDSEIPLNSMAEFALLGFSSRGGQLNTDVSQIYIFAPNSEKGLMSSPDTVILTSEGVVESIPNFDYLTATSMLSRLGMKVSIITLSEVANATGERCQIDTAGHWMQLINGRKFRICPFSDMVLSMLADNTLHLIRDFENQKVVIMKVREILDRRDRAALKKSSA